MLPETPEEYQRRAREAYKAYVYSEEFKQALIASLESKKAELRDQARSGMSQGKVTEAALCWDLLAKVVLLIDGARLSTP